MKNALIIAFLIFSTIASATDYYISSSGNDINNGLSSSTSWKTIVKVNSAFSIMKPGDRILFNRGDTFYGSLVVTASGSAGNPITLGAYGTGANPVITGFTTITGWTNEGSGIYSKTISLESSDSIIVNVDGMTTAIGRFPNSTWATYNSHSGNTSITSSSLNSAVTNWTGAEVVIKEKSFLVERLKIINHISQTLTFETACDTPLDGFGYFIQNDKRTLDMPGEWYYDGTKFYMFFGAIDPTTKTVQVSTLVNGCKVDGHNYVTINNISLKGWGGDGFYLRDAAHITIQNCDIIFCGENGIKCNDIASGDSPASLFDNNTINSINDNGIYVSSQFRDGTISNNNISNVGLIIGATHSRIWQMAYQGIIILGWNSTTMNTVIEYNKLNNIGYSGITFIGNNITVRYNFVNNYMLLFSDGGGIYTYNNDPKDITTVGYIIKNIVLNGKGNLEGTLLSPVTNIIAPGIYIDAYSTGITVDGNTVANNESGSSYFFNGNRRGITKNNTFFNGLYGLRFTTFTDVIDIQKDLRITNNIFFAKNASQFCFFYSGTGGTYSENYSATVIMDSNYYARPIKDDFVFRNNIEQVGYRDYTLAEWQVHRGGDVHSHKSPLALSDTSNIDFYYNTTKANKLITISQPMTDIKGTKYVNNVTLLPFTSVVLMVDPNPSQPVIPVFTGSTIENVTPSLLEINYNASLTNTVPTTASFTVLVNSISRTINSVAISGSKIQLTLSSPVVYGNIVSVAYSKPVTNAVQTPSGGQAATLSAQTVTNNVASLTLPSYVNSSIENATPSLLVITYNMTLANFVPATSAFSVNVNSVLRTVNAVAVSGTEVQLTLGSPIVYGDIVTISYTKPASNQLQTTAGGLAAAITNVPVINSCINIAPIVEITSPIVSNDTTNLNKPPVVKILNPIKGKSYESNSTITLEAMASDPDGSINKVEFYNGSVKLVDLTSAPYTFIWKDVKAGIYSITAIATDNLNATTSSLPIEFKVGANIKYDANSEIVKLYPNPNDGHFSIEFINPLQNEKSELVITDLAGKHVYNGFVSKEETIKQIDLSYIKSGIYILMIMCKGILITKKIIIN